MQKTTRDWVKKAEEDYVLARQGRRSKVPVHDGVCFHCQQCAEKYLKGLMEELGLSVPKTHDLDLLLATLGSITVRGSRMPVRLGPMTDSARIRAFPVKPRQSVKRLAA